MLKRRVVFILAFLIGFNVSLWAKSESELYVADAQKMIQEGEARVITKKELNEIKKKNIKVEISDLEEKKRLVSLKKKEEVSYLEKQRQEEIDKLNKKFDQERLKVENNRNKEIDDVLKMVAVKQKEMEMIDRIEEIALKAKKKQEEQMKIVTLKSVKSIKQYIEENKHINNVLFQIDLVDSLKLYYDAKKANYNYGVLARIKEYLLKIGFSNQSINYDTFRSIVENGTNYDLETLIKILVEERGY